MPKLLLLRAYIETSNGGYYSPIHSDKNCYTLLYIPENPARLRMVPDHLIPQNITDPCTSRKLADYYPIEMKDKPIHRDPRLDLGFYTGYYMPQGRLPKKPGKRLEPGDHLVFMAGLAEYPPNYWDKPHTQREIIRTFRQICRNPKRCGIYIVGGIIIKEIINIVETGWNNAITIHPDLKESPHYYRKNDHPVAVIGKSYILNPPVRISSLVDNRRPSEQLIQIVGERNAYSIARNNYRRSGVLEVLGDNKFIKCG